MKKKANRPKVIGVDFDGTLCQLYQLKRPYVPKQAIRQNPNIKEVCAPIEAREVSVCSTAGCGGLCGGPASCVPLRGRLVSAIHRTSERF